LVIEVEKECLNDKKYLEKEKNIYGED